MAVEAVGLGGVGGLPPHFFAGGAVSWVPPQLFTSLPLTVNILLFGIWSRMGAGPSSVSAPPGEYPRTGLATSICNIERAPVLVCANEVNTYTSPYFVPPLICDVAAPPEPPPPVIMTCGVAGYPDPEVGILPRLIVPME